MKRAVLILLGGLFVLTVALPASSGRRKANATHVEKAETCIRAALRKEGLAVKYIKEQDLYFETHRNTPTSQLELLWITDRSTVERALDPARADLECAVDETRTAAGRDQISAADSRDVRVDLAQADASDAKARKELRPTYEKGFHDFHRQALLFLDTANQGKTNALATLEKATASPPTTTTTTSSPSSNSQTPCNNQNGYDPKFPDYTQLHEYCSKPVTALTIHASVSMTAAGWFGPAFGGAACTGDGSKTVSCANITKLPTLTAFIAYASHKGGWPPGDTASVIFTFADGTKQTETFYPH